MSVAKDPFDDFLGSLGASRYDLLLALLPLPLFLGTAASFALGVPTAVGVGLGGLPSALLLIYGLFLDAPVPDAGGRDRTGRGRDRSGRDRTGGRPDV